MSLMGFHAYLALNRMKVANKCFKPHESCKQHAKNKQCLYKFQDIDTTIRG